MAKLNDDNPPLNKRTWALVVMGSVRKLRADANRFTDPDAPARAIQATLEENQLPAADIQKSAMDALQKTVIESAHDIDELMKSRNPSAGGREAYVEKHLKLIGSNRVAVFKDPKVDWVYFLHKTIHTGPDKWQLSDVYLGRPQGHTIYSTLEEALKELYRSNAVFVESRAARNPQ